MTLEKGRGRYPKYAPLAQLGLVAVGLLAALPFVLDSTGGLQSTLATYAVARPHGAALLPATGARTGAWTVPGIWNWWDVAFMLMLGGIPWNCYFQRVLSCRTPANARKMSIHSGMLTMAFVVPAARPKGRSMTKRCMTKRLTMSTTNGTVQV